LLAIIADQFLRGNILRNAIVRYSFWAFNGILLGTLLNDVLRILFSDFPEKTMVEYGTGAAIAGSGFIHRSLALMGDPLNNAVFGGGVCLGIYWVNRTEDGQPILIAEGEV